MAFKKGDVLVCVRNPHRGVIYLLTTNRIYVALDDEKDGLVTVTCDYGTPHSYPVEIFINYNPIPTEDNHAMRGSTGDGRVNLAGASLTATLQFEELEQTFQIHLRTLETCIELLDVIRKPEVAYNRDQRAMMQNVIDNNSANAELVIHYLKSLLPKPESVPSPTKSD